MSIGFGRRRFRPHPCDSLSRQPMSDQSHRFYRYHHHLQRGLASFEVKHRETDLWIRASRVLKAEAMEMVLTCRHQLEQYIDTHPDFLDSLVPLPYDPFAPPLVAQMMAAARAASVGPMASVAGAIAEAVAVSLKPLSSTIIVENGGDCYMDLAEDITVGIWAGADSPFSWKIGLRLTADRFPLSICTSSGTIGHSLSFGKADAVAAVAKDGALSDAAATALGNLVKTPYDIPLALERASSIPGLDGVVVAIRDKMGAWGNVELVGL